MVEYAAERVTAPRCGDRREGRPQCISWDSIGQALPDRGQPVASPCTQSPHLRFRGQLPSLAAVESGRSQ
jgi:hypothetical protein